MSRVFYIRVSDDLGAEIDELAAAEGLTLTQAVTVLLRVALGRPGRELSLYDRLMRRAAAGGNTPETGSTAPDP